MIGWALLALFAFAPLGSIMVWAWWAGWTFADRQVAWYGGLLGAVIAVLGLIGGPASLIGMFRRESLILGKKCLQLVIGREKVTAQIPYANMTRIELIRNKEGAFAVDFIGIVLADTNDAATLCPEAEPNMQSAGWHYKIPKGFRPMPLEQLYELILKQMTRSG